MKAPTLASAVWRPIQSSLRPVNYSVLSWQTWAPRGPFFSESAYWALETLDQLTFNDLLNHMASKTQWPIRSADEHSSAGQDRNPPDELTL